MKRDKYNKFLAAGVSAVVAASAVPYSAEAASNGFSDVYSGNYFSEAVLDLTEKGIIKGFADGTYRPNQEITRAQAAVILASALELDGKAAKNPEFKDVPSGVWYYSSVAALVEKGIMSGLDKEHFLPGKPVTRAEMAKMLSLGYSLKASSVKTSFTDVPANSWFSGYVGSILENKITAGVSAASFAPGKAVTRGQMAAFIYRAENQTVSDFIEVPEDSVNVPPADETVTPPPSIVTPPPGESTPPGQNDGGTTAPVEGPAAQLAVLSALGFTYGSTAIFLESETVNPTYYQVSEQSVSTPNAGSDLPASVISFTRSAEIKNAQVGRYIQVYETDSNGKIISFKEHQIAQIDIKNFNHYRFVYDKDTVSSTIKIKFNAELSAATLATTQINEVIDVLQVTNESSDQDYNKADLASIEWDTTVEDNPLLVLHFNAPITFNNSHKLQAELKDTVQYQAPARNDVGDFSSTIYSSSEAVRVEHLVHLAFSPDSVNVVDYVSEYLSSLVYNRKLTSIIYENKHNYLSEIKMNAATITDYASLQAVVDGANQLPYLKQAWVYSSSDDPNFQNTLRLHFSENVWLEGLVDGVDFTITVPDSDVPTRNITAYSANSVDQYVDLTFDGPKIPHDGYAEVTITSTGAAKIKDADGNSFHAITLGGRYPGY
ncbi:S-layer homology domain-containing protein [Bacillus sp. ISL-45]|uniref:S-layer homology domain-containing protein n=1 Tax=Bacillus sp. ISL-45 TaxID=2819128 RepID=UPI001BE5133A|nr:S-layer homology domain-containing protein [Bacillus sp. ISL-45]MBT2661582.1 S-layer homology domain-containing protein [Bacillus sp. ISL-45]